MNLPTAGDDLRPHRVVTINAETMRMMSILLDDPNPIHRDPDAVRELGLGDRIINQGPANLAYIMDMLRMNFPQGRLSMLRSRLMANVFEGDAVIAGGQVQSVDEGDEGPQITSAVWLEVEHGARVVEGVATMVLS